jgi:hypothetical protein
MIVGLVPMHRQDALAHVHTRRCEWRHVVVNGATVTSTHHKPNLAAGGQHAHQGDVS